MPIKIRLNEDPVLELRLDFCYTQFMKNAFIIHGAWGTPEENWFPWLKIELEKIGYQVIIPQFPTPSGQNLESWLQVWEQYKDLTTGETVLIGHSIGVAFILNILERLDHPIKASYLVAGFIRRLDNEEVDEINATFYDHSFDWGKIKKNCNEFVCFNSDNDPYVPLERGEEVARNLGVSVTLVEGAGHFNKKVGLTEFPLLLEKIKMITQ
jgi:predicted alpha/beta hydrolase family esterase